MAWGRIDDNLALHPKVIEAGNEAIGLWVRALSYSCQQLTDGFISDAIVNMLGTLDLAERLVIVGLWHVEDGGYSFNDWHDYQPTREAVLAERQAARERMAKVRAKKSAPKKASGSVDVRANFGRTSGEVQEKFGRSSDYVRAPHPIPSHPTSTSNEVDVYEPKKTTRGSRISDSFTVTEDMLSWAREKHPTVDVISETERFIDYWRSVAGERGVKADWVATWRNWIRREAKDARPVKPTAVERGLSLVQQMQAEEQAARLGSPLEVTR